MIIEMAITVLFLLFTQVGSAQDAQPDPAVLERLKQLNAEVSSAYQRGDYEDGIEAAQTAAAYAEQQLAAEDPGLAAVLNNLAALYDDKGDYDRAEPLYQRALAISEKARGPDHPDVATSLNNLALLCTTKGDYARAELLYQRSLAIREKAHGPNHPNVATSLNNLAELYRLQGNYARAEPLYQRALAIWETPPGSNQSSVATALNNLAELYRAEGNYSKAEPLYQRALVIWEATLGPKDLNVGRVLNNLAVLYRSHGDFARAEPLYHRALAIFETKLGPTHPEVGIVRDNLAPFYKGMGYYHRAEPNHLRAVEILEKSVGSEHPELATSLNNLAGMYLAKGDYARAESFYQRALAIAEKTVGRDHPETARSRDNLAMLYKTKGDYARAEPLSRQALASFEKFLGPEHPDVAINLSNLADLEWARGELPYALSLSTRAAAIEEHHLRLILSTGSETQKRAYAETLGGSTESKVSLHLDADPNNPAAARLALATLLQRKGRVLDALTEGLRVLRKRLTAEDRTLLDQLMDVRRQLANLVNQEPGKVEPEQHRKQLDQLETEADRLEAQIANRSAEFRVETEPITVERVQRALPDRSALVEVVRYRPFHPQAAQEKWSPPRYAAYVLFPHGTPRGVILGHAELLDETVEALRAALRTPSRWPRSTSMRGKVLEGGPESVGSGNPARALHELVMRPIRKLLGDTRSVFFSPDGALNLIPISALLGENGHYLIEDYHFTYLTSGRDLLRMQLDRDATGSALVLADPDFGAAGGKSRQSTADRGVRSVDLNRGKIEFGPLPGTAQEAKAIAPLLGTQPLTRARATESALKQVHQPAVLHIATHGFFLPGQSKQPISQLDFDLGLDLDFDKPLSPSHTENPLLRSGLALAGANRLESGTEDGILTALEASSLDLWGTQLVVLSACETGVGKVTTGEGVYGLRRALVNAGAETQVMSLWKVDDAATRDLMVDYYRRLKAGEGRSEALRQAQLSMLHSKDRSHPYYWASFIVSGDWRELRKNGALGTDH